MLTVKHISLSGEEMIYSTQIANFTPERGVNESGPYSPPTVWIEPNHDKQRYPLTGGTVFVMNDKGSTVARYDIGASMVPIQSAGMVSGGIIGPDDAGAHLVGTALGRAA